MSIDGPDQARTLYSMKPFTEAEPFRVKTHIRARLAFKDSDAVEAECVLLKRLDELPPAHLLPVSFAGLRVSSEAARRLLRRALLRLQAGELSDRYLVLEDLGDSVYNVDVMLSGEELIAVERSEEEGPTLRGDVDPAIQQTYFFLCSVPLATASLVQEHFKLANISTATNRLTTLAKLALARRVEQRPVSGGGREFVYAAVK